MKIYSEKFLARHTWDLGGLPIRPMVEMIEPFERPAEIFPSVTATEFDRLVGAVLLLPRQRKVDPDLTFSTAVGGIHQRQ